MSRNGRRCALPGHKKKYKFRLGWARMPRTPMGNRLQAVFTFSSTMKNKINNIKIEHLERFGFNTLALVENHSDSHLANMPFLAVADTLLFGQTNKKKKKPQPKCKRRKLFPWTNRNYGRSVACGLCFPRYFYGLFVWFSSGRHSISSKSNYLAKSIPYYLMCVLCLRLQIATAYANTRQSTIAHQTNRNKTSDLVAWSTCGRVTANASTTIPI